MSGGYYQLVRTDSEDASVDSEDTRRWRPASSGPHAFLYRLRNAFFPSKYSGKFSSPRRRLRDLSSSSIFNLARRRRPPLILCFGIFMGLIITISLYGALRKDGHSFYYIQAFMTTPGDPCLVDRSSPASYVHWDPRSNGKGSIYHCITQRIPQHAINQKQKQPMPVGSRIRSYRPFPAECIDSYYTNGTTCSDGQRTKFDVVWTWVNGSDPMITRARAKALATLSGDPADLEDLEDDEWDEDEEELNLYLYRDHDELRHSLRSVLQYFRESVNRFVILTSDFDFPVTYSPIKYFLGLSERSNPIDRSLKPGKRRSLSRRSEDDGDDDNEPRALARLGLLPQWLKYNVPQEEDESSEKAQGIGKWKDGNVTLEVVHHAEVYDEYDGTVFNSNSIESQLGNLGGNKAFIYFNDDCFFNAPLSSADFHTPHFGLVFRLVPWPWWLVAPHHYPGGSPIGEWHPMEFTNYLISERFGARRRPYTMHQVKVLQGSLMREMWDSWRDQELINRGHKFRGLGGVPEVYGNHTWADEIDPLEPPLPRPEDDDDDGELEDYEERRVKRMIKREEAQVDNSTDTPDHPPQPVVRSKNSPIIEEDAEDDNAPNTGDDVLIDDGDAHVIFLFTHFTIERSREGMLWSWIVGSIGGDNDEFGTSQRKEAWRILTQDAEAEEVESGVLEVLVAKRKTTEPWRIEWALNEIGDKLEAARYRFSSQDGDAYSFYDDVHGTEWWHDDSTYWPRLWEDDHYQPERESWPRWRNCTIKWDTCFPKKMDSASEIFKHVAFRERECGDCILKGLVRASGDLGLSGILPPPDRIYRHNSASPSSAPPKLVPVGENDVPPHLPLGSEWQKMDFSIPTVFASGFWGREEGGIRLRDWVQRMLERYRYVLADTYNSFGVIHNPVDAEKAFADVDDNPKIALLTINDNLEDYPEQTDARMREWFEQRWSTPAAWENPDMLPKITPRFDAMS